MWDYEVKILYDAYMDLYEYADYVERMTFSKEKANQKLTILLWKIMELNFMPFMYPKVYKDYHILNFRNKRIFYKIYENEKLVVVFHVLWQAQNYENYLY